MALALDFLLRGRFVFPCFCLALGVNRAARARGFLCSNSWSPDGVSRNPQEVDRNPTGKTPLNWPNNPSIYTEKRENDRRLRAQVMAVFGRNFPNVQIGTLLTDFRFFNIRPARYSN